MSAKNVWIAFGLGVSAGAAVALLYAPQPGVKTRRQLKKNIEDGVDYLEDAAAYLKEQAEYLSKASGEDHQAHQGPGRRCRRQSVRRGRGRSEECPVVDVGPLPSLANAKERLGAIRGVSACIESQLYSGGPTVTTK